MFTHFEKWFQVALQYAQENPFTLATIILTLYIIHKVIFFNDITVVSIANKKLH